MKSAVGEFLAAFEAVGYHRTNEYEVFGKGDRWYIFEGSTPAVTHVAYLVYKPALRAYAPQFGIFNPASQARAVAALPSIFSYLDPTFKSGIWPLNRRPCWTLFDAAQQLGWRRMCVPEPADPDGWATRFNEILDKLLKPTLWPIDTPSGVMTLLLKNEKPFGWAVSYAVLRTAEIVALAKGLSCSDNIIRETLAQHEPSIVRDMYGSKDFDKMLTTFLRLI